MALRRIIPFALVCGLVVFLVAKTIGTADEPGTAGEVNPTSQAFAERRAEVDIVFTDQETVILFTRKEKICLDHAAADAPVCTNSPNLPGEGGSTFSWVESGGGPLDSDANSFLGIVTTSDVAEVRVTSADPSVGGPDRVLTIAPETSDELTFYRFALVQTDGSSLRSFESFDAFGRLLERRTVSE